MKIMNKPGFTQHYNIIIAVIIFESKNGGNPSKCSIIFLIFNEKTNIELENLSVYIQLRFSNKIV